MTWRPMLLINDVRLKWNALVSLSPRNLIHHVIQRRRKKFIFFWDVMIAKGKKYKYWFMHTFRFKAYFPSIFGYKGFYCPQSIWQNQAYGIAPFCSFIFSAAFYSKFIGIVRNLNDFHLLLPQCESKLDDENVYLRQSALNIRCMTYWNFFFWTAARPTFRT